VALLAAVVLRRVASVVLKRARRTNKQMRRAFIGELLLKCFDFLIIFGGVSGLDL